MVVGTGTGVGKTRLTCALARSLRKSAPTLALKPVESGGRDDALRAAASSTAPRTMAARSSGSAGLATKRAAPMENPSCSS